MSTKKEALAAFNDKLAAVKSQPRSELRAAFPDFAGMEAAAARDMAQRKAAAEARNAEAVRKSHVPKTATEYRGAGAAQLPHKTKNEATDSRQLSVPIENRKPFYADLPDGVRLGKKTCDVCHCERNGVVSGRGSLFAPEKVSTFRGWKPGMI